jgi:Na+-translocating ferredoxin:NAD+ oxidoreductase RNF subunit RnfB
MNGIMIETILTLSTLGVVSAVILFLVAKKFRVEEDPRIDAVESALPSTNCGGCGYPGCRSFAEALVNAENLDALHCPVGGNETMKSVAAILGKHVEEKDPYVAVVRCSGSFEHRNKTNVYDGVSNCAIAASLYSGDTGCAYGCLGMGDCVDSCDFEAMYMDPKTGLPVVLEDKCTACNACVTACPKDIMQLWPKGKKNRRIFVACLNEEKGGIAKKNCSVACIGCSKCADECKFDAITVTNFLAYIDYEKCKLCRKCVDVCPTTSISAINFPERKPKPEKTEKNPAVSTSVTSTMESGSGVDVIEMIKANAAKKPDNSNKADQDSDINLN